LLGSELALQNAAQKRAKIGDGLRQEFSIWKSASETQVYSYPEQSQSGAGVAVTHAFTMHELIAEKMRRSTANSRSESAIAARMYMITPI